MMADKKNNVKRNIAYDTFYRILTNVTPFITAPYVARVIGAEGIGIQSYTQAIQAYFIMFATLGTSYYGAREIAYHKDDEDACSKVFWEIEILSVITTAICFLLWIPLVITSAEYGRFYLVLSLGIIGTALDISWFYTGLEKFKAIVIRNTVVKIAEVILLFLLVKGPDDLIIYIAISAVTSFLCIVSYWIGLGKLVKKVPFGELRIGRHFKGTLIFFLPSVASSIYLMLDKPLISWITKDNAEVGYYQQASKFIEVLKSLVFVSINYVVGVRMSSLYAHGEFDEMKEQFNHSMNYILLMGFGCSFGLSAIASNLIPVFYGSGYEEVVPLIYLFSPVVVIIGVSNCLETQYFTPCGRRAESIRYLVAGAVTNLTLNLILIPHLKAFGATVATVTAELVITVLYIVNSRKMISFSSLLKMSWKKFLSGLLMFILVMQIGKLNLNDIICLCVQVCSGVIAYFLFLALLRDSWTLDFMRNAVSVLRPGKRDK